MYTLHKHYNYLNNGNNTVLIDCYTITQGSSICFLIVCSVCSHTQSYLLSETMGKARC